MDMQEDAVACSRENGQGKMVAKRMRGGASEMSELQLPRPSGPWDELQDKI